MVPIVSDTPMANAITQVIRLLILYLPDKKNDGHHKDRMELSCTETYFPVVTVDNDKMFVTPVNLTEEYSQLLLNGEVIMKSPGQIADNFFSKEVEC